MPLLRSMRTGSPVFSNASPPPAAASGEALRIDGDPDVPDWRPSPMQGSDVMPRLISAAGGCMFTTSARARIADRPDAADEQHRVLVDLELGIVDAVVIILRSVEHDGAAFEGVRIFRIEQIAIAEFLRDHAQSS